MVCTHTKQCAFPAGKQQTSNVWVLGPFTLLKIIKDPTELLFIPVNLSLFPF